MDEARGRIVELEAEIAALRAQAGHSAEELEALRGTRRYRLAGLLARPLDRYRARRDGA
jgi:hypothetical protein